MRIDSITTFQAVRTIPGPRAAAFGLSGESQEVIHVYVKTTDDQGRTGVGETIFAPRFAASPQEMIRLIEETYGPAIVGLSPLDRVMVLRSLEDADPENPAARAALDLALHDLVGKILEVPSLVLLGGAYQRKHSLVGVLPQGGVDRVIERALELRETGFDTLKLLVGADPDADLELVARVREAIGHGVRLRVAANEQYSLVTATRVLKKMEEYGIELVEQPLSRTNLDGLAELCSLLDMQVLTTLSITSLDEAIRVIGTGATDIVGINCIEAGGLHNALKIAHMAQAANLPCCVVGYPLGPIGTSADLQLASATNGHGLAVEIPGPFLLDERDFEDPLLDVGSAREGFLMVPDRPGLL